MTLHQPLSGVRVVEFETIGPCPMAGRILQDMGAEVKLVARPAPIGLIGQLLGEGENPLHAGKTVHALDLKASSDDRRAAVELVAAADVLIEGLRPGVMERLGLGPRACAEVNPRLVYARMTGWGQNGPLAHAAGHDLNYVALSGLLSLGKRAGEAPIVPPTVLGDAAGALALVMGISAALFDIRNGSEGRVIDAAICDVSAMLGMLVQMYEGMTHARRDRPSVFHDSPFYDVYECACGGHITVAAMEPQFYTLLLDRLGFDDVDPRAQYDEAQWPALKARIAETVRGRTRDEWCNLLEGSDTCFAPVLQIDEAPDHPHNRARDNFRTASDKITLGNSAPKFLPLSGSKKDVTT